MSDDIDLLTAVDQHNADAVRRALENGADPNTRTKEGTYALHIAACRGYLDIVRLLVEAEADLGVTEPIGDRTPLHLAQNADVVELLTDAGANINARTKGQQDTPLHNPILKIPAIEKLISAGADLNAKNILGWTPLHTHTFYTDMEIVSLLLGRGADANAKNADGDTALDVARWVDEAEISALIEKHMLTNCATKKRLRQRKGGLGL